MKVSTVQVFVLLFLVASVQAQRCKDYLSRKDCKTIKRGDYYYDDGKCHLYSKECKKTCGCDYDPSADRESYGLDDTHYESDDFQCVNGKEFEDSYKFNCTLYEGAKWCKVNKRGDVVEGPGWCKWAHKRNSNPCTVRKSRRWDKFETFNRNGRWANSCCCNTGIAETYPYETGGECVDHEQAGGLAWHDQYGYSCRAYHFGSFCKLDGKAGSGWDPKNGHLSSYKYDGKTVLKACCTCGGGMWRP